MTELRIWSPDEVAALEQEVARCEQTLATVQATIRATSAEIQATGDPRQFDRDAFRAWFVHWPGGPGNGEAIFGFMAGLFAGGTGCYLLALARRLLGW